MTHLSLEGLPLEVLRETLGVDAAGKRRGYRNRYVARAGSPQNAICNRLKDAGLMTGGSTDATVKRGELVYTATHAGRVAAANPLAWLHQDAAIVPAYLEP